MTAIAARTTKAILCDVDGTLVDSNDFHAEAWQRAIAHFGRDLPLADVRAQIGKGADTLLPALLDADFLDEHREAIEAWRGDIFKSDYLGRIRPFPQVRALFERMRTADIRIVLASSGTSEEVEHHLELVDAADLVEGFTTAEDAARSKPHPDIFASALAKLGDITERETIVIGDSPYDMQAARALDLRTIALRCGGSSDAALTQAGASALYNDPADLLRRFDQAFT